MKLLMQIAIVVLPGGHSQHGNRLIGMAQSIREQRVGAERAQGGQDQYRGPRHPRPRQLGQMTEGGDVQDGGRQVQGGAAVDRRRGSSTPSRPSAGHVNGE